MRKTNSLLYIAFLSVLLSSCVTSGGNERSTISENSSLDSSLGVSSASGHSSEDMTSEGVSSSFKGSSKSTATSDRINSSGGSSSAPDSRIYFTISVFQSYLIPDKGIYGNPRLDFRTKAEAGKPLYSDREEIRNLMHQCHPVYTAEGQAYTINFFYSDETCLNYITSQVVVISDMNIYYYCNG